MKGGNHDKAGHITSCYGLRVAVCSANCCAAARAPAIMPPLVETIFYLLALLDLHSSWPDSISRATACQLVCLRQTLSRQITSRETIMHLAPLCSKPLSAHPSFKLLSPNIAIMTSPPPGPLQCARTTRRPWSSPSAPSPTGAPPLAVHAIAGAPPPPADGASTIESNVCLEMPKGHAHLVRREEGSVNSRSSLAASDLSHHFCLSPSLSCCSISIYLLEAEIDAPYVHLSTGTQAETAEVVPSYYPTAEVVPSSCRRSCRGLSP